MRPQKRQKQKTTTGIGFSAWGSPCDGWFCVPTPLGVFGLLSVNRLGGSTRGTGSIVSSKNTFLDSWKALTNPCDNIGPLQIDFAFTSELIKYESLRLPPFGCEMPQ